MPTAPSVQEKIDIADIKDGVVILKDKTLRAVLMTSSVNFALKSTEEQDALTFHFQGFLNSLDFPIQILVTSRKFDITSYLEILDQKKKEQTSELLRIQTSEYIDFIRSLTDLANIITESFYVVVPLAPIESRETGILGKFKEIIGQKKTTSEEKQSFEELKTQLWQRVGYVSSGLENIGVRSSILNTNELIELYYRLYNPEAKEKPSLSIIANKNSR